MKWQTAATVAAAALALAACGDPGPATPPPASSGPSSSSGSSSQSGTPSASPAGNPPPTTLADACFEGTPGTISGVAVGPDSELRVGRIGEGSTVAIMLPQVTGGMCGWAPYAAWAAKAGRITTLLVDPCGTGRSTCSPAVRSGDPAEVVKAVVDHARTGLKAQRVVLVGASAGGSTALATAQEAGADAVVDLSGPADWEGVDDAGTAAKRTTLPLLIACADDDVDVAPDLLRKAVADSPAKVKHYLVAPDGHGWLMLSDGQIEDPEITEVGRQVLAWIVGDYTEITG